MSANLVMFYWSADDGKTKHTLGYFENSLVGEMEAADQFDNLYPDEPRLIVLYRSGERDSFAYLSHTNGRSLWEFAVDFRYDFPN